MPPETFDAAFDGYAAALRASRDRAHALTDGLSGEQANWKPGPKAWSVAECLVHLNVVAAGYVPVLDRTVVAAPPRPADPAPLRYGIVGALSVRAVRPGSWAIPTLPSMRPPATTGTRSAHDLGRVLALFDRHSDELIGVVERARGTDAGRVRVPSPFLSIVRLPLAASLDELGQHALRHVGQAERVVLQPGFPAAGPSG